MALVETEFVFGTELVFAMEFVAGWSAPASFRFGTRVVTQAMGTPMTLVRERVSISAVTDMPGRKSSFSVKRMRT